MLRGFMLRADTDGDKDPQKLKALGPGLSSLPIMQSNSAGVALG
jgi:hypothetical protein